MLAKLDEAKETKTMANLSFFETKLEIRVFATFGSGQTLFNLNSVDVGSLNP